MFELFKAVIFGIVQGITEWLPISSTGHMILLDEFLPLNFSKAFLDTFLVIVQLGSILAVVVLFFHKLWPFSPRKSRQEKRDTWELWFKVLVGSIPTGIIGILFEDQINAVFYGAMPVAVTLILYGVFFILIERKPRVPSIHNTRELSYKTAFFIGAFQALALIPGTSRSGSTILGGMLCGMSRPAASQFTFFLAIPVMAGASLLKLVKFFGKGNSFTLDQTVVLIVGCAVAFIVSIIAIRFLMDYVKRHTFTAFGVYRIALGIVVLVIWGVQTFVLKAPAAV